MRFSIGEPAENRFILPQFSPEASKSLRSSRVKVSEGGPGILSLGFELLGAVAIRLAQRYAKSWSAGLMAQLKSSADVPTVPPCLTDAGSSILARPRSQSEAADEKVREEKSYSKGIIALFKNTANEWLEDKCPQLGAALAYFTVFSLAPLVVALLAVLDLSLGAMKWRATESPSSCNTSLTRAE